MKWFLPVLFISYMAGITLFTHSHVVNGVTIVHSHPFKKGGEHSHTTVEFQLIHILDHTLVTDNGLTPLLDVYKRQSRNLCRKEPCGYFSGKRITDVPVSYTHLFDQYSGIGGSN